MNLHHLRLFYTVAQLSSVTEAAKVLHISQPAVTAQLKKFQAELGLELIQPVGRGIALTPLGLELYQGSKKLFAEEAKIEGLIKQATGMKQAQVSIASNSIGIEKLLPRSLQKFKEEMPDLAVQLANLNSTDALAAVVGGEAQLGITGSPVKEIPDLAYQKISVDQLVYCVSSKSDLAGAKLYLAELSSAKFIGRENQSFVQQKLLSQFAEAGLKAPIFSVVFNHSQGAIDAAIAGQGIHYCSRLLVSDYLKAGTLAEVQVLDSQDEHPLYLSWSKTAKLTPAVKKLKEIILKEV